MTVAPHPEPPGDLASREVPLQRWSAPVYRLYRPPREPMHFGRGACWRFDDPEASFGVIYAAADVHGAFIEVFGRDHNRVVTISALAAVHLATIVAERDLVIVDLATNGTLARIGADARLCAGDDYGCARRWARALHDHPSRPDGLLYPLRHDPARNGVAVFDRAASSLLATPAGSLFDMRHRRLLVALLDRYGFGLVKG